MKYLPLAILLSILGAIGFATIQISHKNIKNPENETSTRNIEENDAIFHETNLALPDFSLGELFSPNETLSKADFRQKYSLVNFFASWCTTCVAEHEILLRIKSKNLIDIYGIAWRDIDSEAKKFLKKRGNPYKKVGVDSSGLFTKIAGINAIPETWIVDQNGVVVRKIVGNLQEFAAEEIEEFLASHR